jgi:hypothetical protein
LRNPEPRAKERIDKDEPKITLSITDNAKQLPTATTPRALQLEPIRTKFRNEQELPILAKSRHDNADPRRANDRSDSDEPRSTAPKADVLPPTRNVSLPVPTEMLFPNRTKPRVLKLDPSWKKSIQLMDEPSRANDRNEQQLPMLMASRTERREANLTVFATEKPFVPA